MFFSVNPRVIVVTNLANVWEAHLAVEDGFPESSSQKNGRQGNSLPVSGRTGCELRQRKSHGMRGIPIIYLDPIVYQQFTSNMIQIYVLPHTHIYIYTVKF